MAHEDPPGETRKREAELEARVVELEVRAAYQEKIISDLDGVVREFTLKVERMHAELARAREALEGMRETGPANDPPPHY